MNINKHTNIDDLEKDALLLKKRSEAQVKVKQRWSTMNRKERIKFFKDYYTKPLIIGLIILAAIIYLIINVVNKQNIAMRCAIMNQQLQKETTESFSDSFMKYLKLDNKKNVATFKQYDTLNKVSQEDIAMGAEDADLSDLSKSIGARQIDTMIAEPTTFDAYLRTRSFCSIDSIFTKEELDKLKDVLYTPTIKENGDKRPYGIYLSKSTVYQELFKTNKKMVNEPILAIMNNSRKIDTAKKFVYFLYPELLN